MTYSLNDIKLIVCLNWPIHVFMPLSHIATFESRLPYLMTIPD